MLAKCASVLLLLVLAGVPSFVFAQSQDRTILLLLKDTPGAPTPEQIVTYANTWPHAATPPLQAFNVKDPQTGGYLLPERASGDFLAWLQANLNSARRKLEDYVLMTFASATDIPEALAALRADPFVAEADVPLAMNFHTAPSTGGGDWGEQPSGSAQYGWDEMKLDAAWQITGGGYALVTQIDAGLYEDHPSLRQFSGATYVGGNYIPVASKDIGLTGLPPQAGFDPSDLDEAKSMFVGAGACTSIDTYLPPDHLGHGTHVAGLLGANPIGGQSVRGTCKHCGIVAYRTAFLECYGDLSPPEIAPTLNFDAADRGKTEAVDGGATAISMSFGAPNNDNSYNCLSYRNHPICLTITYAVSHGTAMIASSGNNRHDLDFPASDARIISAGGFAPGAVFWDDWPNCPPGNFVGECGSNLTLLHNGYYFTHQELLGSAKRVLSTVYPNMDYAAYAECGDSFGTPSGDGLGWCTGTSMSAPQIAGVFGVLRSVNPLAPTGDPEPAPGQPPGLRTALAQTATQAQAGQPWSPVIGYGVPDAAAAARTVLGKVAGATVRNRATPLFRLYGAYAKDFAETTSPQYALSLMIAQTHQYTQPSAGLGVQPIVPGYVFPHDTDDPADNYDSYESPHAAPRAAIYVLTTAVRPSYEWPAVIPLHLMDKPKAGGRDYLLATPTHIEPFHADGYNLRTIQGYIYQPCTPEPACIPPAAQPIYRACKAADSDCATFLESERAVFEANGYTTAYPAGSDKKLGYAYSATDTDGDGLPDGFEQLIGTHSALADSDSDGATDNAEFPLAGIANSDPCSGGAGARYCPADIIFENGFDGL